MYKRRLYLFYLIFFLFSFNVFAQGSESGVITELSGTVELKVSVASPFVPANVGDLVEEDTIISTGFSSSALIELGSVILLVRPLTRLTLTEISASQGAETLNVNLQAGRVRVDVNPPAGARAAMTVTSPSATASVRGTSFDFDTRNLAVHKGQVGFKGNTGYTVVLGAGFNGGLGNYGSVSNTYGDTDSGYYPTNPVGKDTSAGIAGGLGGADAETPAPPPRPDDNSTPSGGGGGNGPEPNNNVTININYN